MKRLFGKVISILTVALLLGLAICTVVLADDGTTYYLKFGVPFVDISGDFDGVTGGTFESNDKVSSYVPECDSGDGFSVLFGGARGHWGGEIYYLRTTFDSTFYDTGIARPGKGTYVEFGMNVKYYFAEYEKATFNGFVLGGIGYASISSTNAAYYSYDADTSVLGSGSFTGEVFNLGIGALVRLGDHLTLDCQYFSSWADITKAKAFGAIGKPDFNLVAVEEKYEFGLAYCF